MPRSIGNKWDFLKSERIRLQIVRFSDYKMWRACEKLEYEIFLESGYISASDDQRINEFDRFNNMEFVAVMVIKNENVPFEKRLSGAVRVIYGSDDRKTIQEQFPTLLHAKRLNYSYQEALSDPKLKPPYENNQSLWLYSNHYDRVLKLDPRKCIDIAAMAIIPSRRDGNISKILVTGVLLRGWEQSPIRYAIAAADETFYKKIKERNLPFEALGPSIMYWGSPTIPTLVDSFEIPKGFQRLLIPFYRLRGYLNLRGKRKNYG